MSQAHKMQNLVSILRNHLSSSRPSFQVLSDLHLEVGQQYSTFQIPVSAPYLILAGDIGRFSDYSPYLAFLKIQCSRFAKVFLVPGNHEFYGTSHGDGLELARKLETEPDLDGRLVLCHQRRFDVPGSDITILACSLWSHIPDDAQDAVRMKVNDFKKIKDWSVEAHNHAHQSDLEWLRAEVEAIRHQQNTPAGDNYDGRTDGKGGRFFSQNHQSKPNKRSILIITHHAPCKDGTSEPRFASNPWNSAFATDLLTGSHEWQDVKLWIFGHTHYSTEFIKDGIRVLSNQRGYVLPGPQRKSPEGYGKGLWKVFNLRKVVGL
jgi:predicted phosphodiesterase